METFEEKPIEENFYLCTEVFFGPYSSMINRLFPCRCQVDTVHIAHYLHLDSLQVSSG